jgi:hypothetical protein
MLEHRRQHYLSLLGIENYVPTRILTAAAPSVLLPDELLIDPALLSHDSIQTQFIIPDDNESADESASSEVHIPATSSVDEAVITNAAVVDSLVATLGSPRALLEEELLAQASDQSKPKAPVDTDGQTTETLTHIIDANQSTSHTVLGPIKFVFSVWRVKDILILDMHKVREALPTDHLLQNILRSVGYSVAQLPASESLRWPLFNNKKFTNKKFTTKNVANKQLDNKNTTTDPLSLSAEQYKNDSEQASAMVQAYISAQHSKLPLKYLFLMGEETSTFSLNDAIDFADCNGTALFSTFWEDVQCLLMPSLYSMLQDPASKRIAWNALQSMNKSSD